MTFKQQIQATTAYINAENFKKPLLLKGKNIEHLQDIYRQAKRYGIDYLKQNPNLSVTDVKIVEDILKMDEL